MLNVVGLVPDFAACCDRESKFPVQHFQVCQVRSPFSARSELKRHTLINGPKLAKATLDSVDPIPTRALAQSSTLDL